MGKRRFLADVATAISPRRQDPCLLICCGIDHPIASARGWVAAATDPQTRRVSGSATRLTDTLADVSVHVIPCLQTQFDGNDLVVAPSAWVSITPAK